MAEVSDGVICSREQFSFQMCLESNDGGRTFSNWRQTDPAMVHWLLFIMLTYYITYTNCHHYTDTDNYKIAR